MSQFHSDDFKRERNVSVRSAVPIRKRGFGAFLFSLVFFVPLVPLVGAFMGIGARRMNAAAPNGGGGAFATLAVVLGLVLTVGQLFAGFRGYECYLALKSGPAVALAAGFGNDTAGFTGAFAEGTGANAADAKVFIDELRSRYGAFRGAKLKGSIASGSLGAPRPYVLVFENGIVMGEAEFEVDAALGPDWLTSKLVSIRVQDPKNGNLGFPGTAAGMVTQEPTDH